MTRYIYILLIAIFGFAMIPNVATACSVKAEKSCCKKEEGNQSEEKDCCKKSEAHSNNKSECSGKCGEKSCLPSTSPFSVLTAIYQENNYKLFNSSAQQQKFSSIKAHLSSGFYSIWTPPNIS